MSRQQAWQLQQLALGNCAVCGKPRNLYARLCDSCQSKRREIVRKEKAQRKALDTSSSPVVDSTS